MTLEELARQALDLLAQLGEEELRILQEQLDSTDIDLLAQRVAENAKELWTPADESGVPPDSWVQEYINVTIDLFHDQKRAFEAQALREAVGEFIDSLSGELRALVCCMVNANHRGRVVAVVAHLAREAINHGLVDGAELSGAIKKTLEMHLAAFIADVDAQYFGNGERRSGRN